MRGLEVLDRAPPAGPVVLGALSQFLRPPPRIGVADWAERHRVVAAESGSRYPGPWRNDRAPHLTEIMEALGPDDPCEDVVFVASAQVGKSEVGLNFFGYVATVAPGPMIIVLPSLDEASKYVRTKLEPAISETPALRTRVLEVTHRSERGSTASFKRYRGGYAQITFAGSSKGLQMLSARYTIGEEVSEWPATSGERGDPVEQLKVRTQTYERDRKRLWVSTPSLAGNCRVTALYERSDKRRRYVPCPQCGVFQVLRFERLKWDRDSWPHGAWFECAANGCRIAHADKPAMLAGGVWIATAGDDAPAETLTPDEIASWRARTVPGRVRGFHLWQALSPFTSWDSIVAEYVAARGSHERMRVFTQQVLGETWEDRGDAPEAEKLYAARVPEFRKGRPPAGGPVVFTGAVDVQGDRLEWAVWGWSEGMTRWLVDWGVVRGDPHGAEPWREMGRLAVDLRYAVGDALHGVDAWAVDSGFASHSVYQFCRGRPGVFAVDGRAGRTEPMVGTPKRVDVRWSGRKVAKGATLWPVGTFALKSDLYAAIRRAIAGPDANGAWSAGSMILPGDVDLAYCEQLTAEHIVEKETRSGVVVRAWAKLTGRPNEALDLACYARAMASHLRLDRLTPEAWAALRAERTGAARGPQGDLFAAEVRIATVAPEVAAEVRTAPQGDAPAPADGRHRAPRTEAKPWIGRRGRWL